MRMTVGLIPIFVVAGCANQPKDNVEFQSAVREVTVLEKPAVHEQDYAIAPGDELIISFSFHPTFNQRMEVRPDGKISLPLLQDVAVAGRSPTELARALEESYSGELKNPDIVVIVHRSSGQVAFVGGEVRIPRMIPLSRPTTLLQAVIQSGNLKSTAEEGNVLVLRATPGEAPRVLAVNLKRVRRGEATGLLLQPYDVVYVPKTVIAQVGEFVDSYINQIVPRAMGFQFVYNIKDQVQLEDDSGRILFSRTNVR